MGVVDQSSTRSDEVDHDKTSNRTHSGDSLMPASVDVSDSVSLPSYPSLSDVPQDLDEGTLVWVSDENTVYKETGE